MYFHSFQAAERFDCQPAFLYDFVVVDVFGHTADSVSAHLRLRTVGIEYAHTAIGLFARQNGNDSVGAHTRMMAAHFNSQPGKVVERTLHAVDICEIVAQPVHLHERDVVEFAVGQRRGVVLKRPHGITQAPQTLVENSSRHTHVHTHIAGPFASETAAVAKRKARTIHEKPYQLMLGKTEPAEIKPYRERCLRNTHLYLRKFSPQKLACVAHIGLQIFQCLVEPCLSAVIRSLRRHHCRDRRCVELAGRKPSEERLAQARRPHHGPCAHYAGDVKCLGRSTECDSNLRGLFRHCCRGYVPTAAQHHVAIDFVRHKHHPAVITYIRHTPQRVGIPLQSDRVMGITYKNHLGTLAFYHIKQPVKVHRIPAGSVDSQRVVHRAAPVAIYHRTERMVDRRLYHHGIARFREIIDAKAQSLL